MARKANIGKLHTKISRLESRIANIRHRFHVRAEHLRMREIAMVAKVERRLSMARAKLRIAEGGL